MPEPFIQTADVSNTIKNILEHYPLVDGPIREVLQNSDDAGATRQIFVLDQRNHPISSLAAPEYIGYQQSPSLIAYNDAYFQEHDWKSLKSIFDSSKAQDATAFGQFGQGFRCVYHLTDCPQIFSGDKLALLNLPQGITLDMTNEEDAKNTSHIVAFHGVPGVPYSSTFPSSTTSSKKQPTFPPLPTAASNGKGKNKENEKDHPHINGTLIRLPLRSRSSSLSIKCHTPQSILKLFSDFIYYDLECILLFLKNIKKIEIYEISPQGVVREICSATAKGDEDRIQGGEGGGSGGGDFVTWRCVVETRVSTPNPSGTPTPTIPTTPVRPISGIGVGTGGTGGTTTKTTTTTWRILSCPFTDTSSVEVLKRIPKEYSPEEEMTRRKLDQRVRVAAPLSFVTSFTSAGNSASVLTSTSTSASVSAAAKSFSAAAAPANVDAGGTQTFGVGYWRNGRLFHGLPLPRSNDQKWPIHVDAKFALTPSRSRVRSFHEGGFIGEWNMILFGAFIPQAWTFLLNVLAREDKVKDIFEYWPPPGGSNEFHAPAGVGSRGVGAGIASESGTGGTSGVGRSQSMLQTLFDCVIIAKPAIWPVYVAVASPSPASPARTVTTTRMTNSPARTAYTIPRSATPPPNPVLQVPASPLVPEYAELGNLKIAKEDVHFPDLRNALADCGIRFTKPPVHFKSLIEGCKIRQFRFLEPDNVHQELLRNVPKLEQAITSVPKHANSILDFLLKSHGVQLLVGLPLLKNVDGQYITLQTLVSPKSSAAAKQTLHPLLNLQSAPLFRAYDSNAIALHELPRVIATNLEENGPGNLNVAKLTAEKVVEYLSSDPRWTSAPPPPPPPSTPTSPTPASLTPLESTQWLAKFYQWLSGQSFASDFLQIPEVRELYIVPTQLGLKRVVDPVFDMMGATTLRCLRALGVGMLDPAVGFVAKTFLTGAGGVLRKDGDVKGILDGAIVDGTAATTSATSPSTSLGLTCLEWKPLIDYIVRHAQADQLGEEQRRKLRLLPIYPLLDPFDSTHTPRPEAIPENKIVHGVTSVDLLPIIDGCVYLDLRGYLVGSHGILHFLSTIPSSNERPLTSGDLLSLGVRNFGSQPPEIQGSIVSYVVKHEKSIPRETLEKLWEMSFIVCRDGVVRRPGEVVDPTSTGGLGGILSICVDKDDVDGEKVFDECLPRMESDADKEIMAGLKKLPMSPLKTALDQALLLKITAWISRNTDQKAATEASRRLLKLLTTNLEYGVFVEAIPKDHKWIPTNAGLKAPHECRDRNPHYALFDEVYALVDDGIQVTDVLRDAFGWTQKLSHDNLFDQLDATLRKGGDYTKIREIVKAIGSDKIAQEDLERLRGLLDGQAWVPTTARNLVKPEDAVLGHAGDETGFFEVSFNEAAYPEVVEFLRHMGVRDRPATDTIVTRIEKLSFGLPTPERTARVVKLLECLPANLDDDSKARLVMPDIHGLMHPISNLQFNDTGSPPDRLPRNIKPLAHPSVTESLARALGIEPLASKLSTFSGHMGESFATSIRKVLADYNETQMLPEMLANAVDAGAKRFILILDDMPAASENLISPNLENFQRCPALLVYNDAEFTEEDFEGLCSTGEGSKAHKRNSIGQFGRGALTMFHITEFPMLVSSTHALFIDPSRKHLQNLPPNANNQRMELKTLRDYYFDHLDFLGGLGDCLELPGDHITSFSGTMFRLPLRQESHIEHGSAVSSALWWPNDARQRILAEFKAIAGRCFLFTELESIRAYSRNRDGLLEELWDFQAIPAASEPDGEFSRRMVQIQENRGVPELWQTVSYLVPEEDIPDYAASLIENLHLREPKVELAAFIRPEEASYQDYHERSVLFSTMPLTENTGLPVHCSATFITTSDRRHIRLQLDNDPGNQARYNMWLLEEIVPPVYLYLLELLLTDAGAPNQHFWPINDLTPADRAVIPALYERYLKNSDRRLFESAYESQHHLTPVEVVILPEGSPIEPVVDFLAPRNVAKYSEPFLSRVTDDAELPPVSPRFLREQIINNSARLTQAFLPSIGGGDPQLSTEVLGDLLAFFIEHDPEQLFDLQLLPLEDNTLATITRSTSRPTYYVWNHPVLPQQFLANTSRLVKLDFDANILLGKGFNVEGLKSSSTAALIEERFPKRASIDASPEQRQFIHAFWTNFQLLQLEVEHILDFPLVPTLSPNRFISLNSCKHGGVPIVPTLIDAFVCRCLSSLGVPLVQRSPPSCPPPLSRILHNKNDFPDFKMRDILRALEDLNPQLLVTKFHDLDADRAQFSAWMRQELFHDVPPNLRSTARALPVWEARDNSGIHEYIPAEQLVVLPERIDAEIVAQYITQQHIAVIPEDQGAQTILRSALNKLDVPVLSFRHLLAAVRVGLPRSMPLPAERQAYKQLIEATLEHMPDPLDGIEELQLPDAFDFTLQPVKEFYASDESLFHTALPPNHPKFVSLEFRSLEGQMSPLKRLQDIDMEIFAQCVESIANDSNEEGGRVALQVLNNRLPVILGGLGPEAHQWNLINHVEFIPKFTEALWRPGVGTEAGSGDAGLDVSQYMQRPFDNLVAPQHIVREECVGIAWSQRTLPSIPLSESLIRAFPALGVPNIDDVIAHLRVLVTQVANDHPNHPAILPDLVATYKYLDEKTDESAAQLSLLRDEMLFLNVDDPSEDWAWESAANLSLDIRDVGRFRSVRRFLHKYRSLLVAAGAQEVNHPQLPEMRDTSSDLQRDTHLQKKFNELRRRKKLVDVKFIARDDDPDSPLIGHRSFLAAVSDYLMEMFCSDYLEGGPASPDNLVSVPMEEYSRACISFVLDYIYGTMTLESAPVPVLLEGLKLANYWNMTDLFELIQDCIIENRLVNPGNLGEISNVAAEVNCQRLVDACEMYRRDNAVYISQFQV